MTQTFKDNQPVFKRNIKDYKATLQVTCPPFFILLSYACGKSYGIENEIVKLTKITFDGVQQPRFPRWFFNTFKSRVIPRQIH